MDEKTSINPQTAPMPADPGQSDASSVAKLVPSANGTDQAVPAASGDDEPAFELPGIAERREQARSRVVRTRSGLWAAEPAIALLVGAAFFALLAPTGLLLPLLGNDGGSMVVSPVIWALVACAVFAAVGISALRLRALARGKTDLTARHLRGREVALILLVAVAFALLWLAAAVLAPGA
jgi:hypothetical protein